MRLERNKASSCARLRAEDGNECGGGLRFEKKARLGELYNSKVAA